MLERLGNNIRITFNGVTKEILFFEFSFKEVGEFVIIYQNEKILFRIPKSEIDIDQLTTINIIKGENGKDGKDGRDGKNGKDGKDGVDGKNGQNGKDGVDGRNGRDGKDGINGKDGKDGRDGEPFKPSSEFIESIRGKDGKDGTNGLNGIDGKDGKDGQNGKNGINGIDGENGISFIWSGEYELGEDYEKNEVVELEGSSFICIKDTDEAPIKDNEINREFWDLVALRGKNGRNGRNGIDAASVTPIFQEITWDVTNDTLPITSSSVNYLNIDFDNFNGDINLTGQLPTNLKVGARLILRKIDTKRGRITYNDGVIFYTFVKNKGDYLELIWNGNKFII